jgi:hypothetical protein
LTDWRDQRGICRTSRYADAGATFKSLGDPWCDTTTPRPFLDVLALLFGLGIAAVISGALPDFIRIFADLGPREFFH